MRTTAAAVAGALTLALAGCGAGESAPAATPPGQSQVQEQAAGAGPVAEAPLDVSLRHPNGTAVRLTRVTAAGNQIGVVPGR